MIYKKHGHILLKSLSLIAVLPNVCNTQTTAVKTVKSPLYHSDNKTNLNMQENGLSPLQLAIAAKNLELVEFLLENKANPNYVAPNGTTPLTTALKLDSADQQIQLSIINALIKAGVNINRQDAHGNTALMYAVRHNNLILTQFLIASEATNLNLQNIHGDTALIYAARHNNHPALAEVLINAGALLNIQKKNGDTALIMAAKNNNLATVQALIKAGANLNLQEKRGCTALIRAAINNNFAIVKALIKAKANVNIQNNNGDTVLIWAAISNNPKMVKALIKAGANVDHKDDEGNTAFDSTTDATTKTILKAATQA